MRLEASELRRVHATLESAAKPCVQHLQKFFNKFSFHRVGRSVESFSLRHCLSLMPRCVVLAGGPLSFRM